MNNYYNSLAREQMMIAQTAFEKADEYLAIASRNSTSDMNFRKSIAQLKKNYMKNQNDLPTLWEILICPKNEWI